jgi:hypothetical protein
MPVRRQTRKQPPLHRGRTAPSQPDQHPHGNAVGSNPTALPLQPKLIGQALDNPRRLTRSACSPTGAGLPEYFDLVAAGESTTGFPFRTLMIHSNPRCHDYRNFSRPRRVACWCEGSLQRPAERETDGCDEGRCSWTGLVAHAGGGGKTLERIWKNQPDMARFSRSSRTPPDVQKEQSLTYLPAGQGLYLLVMNLQE